MAFKKIQLAAQIVGLVTILVLSVSGVLALASGNNPASAALEPATLSGVSNVINYQGTLRQPDGTPVNGTYSMTFRLYDEPTLGTLLHTETLTEVVVYDGLFTVLLGDADGNAIDAAAFQKPLYVGIQVGNNAEMEPRQRIAPVPYAVQLTDGIYVDEDGNVGIGTTSPAQKLDVNGDISATGNISATSNIDAIGDITFGGSLDGFGIIFKDATDKCAGGATSVTLGNKFEMFCALGSVRLENFDDAGAWDDGRCYVTTSGDNWVLVAHASCYDPNLEWFGVECTALCLTNIIRH